MEMSDKTNASKIDQRDDENTPIHSNQSINTASNDTIQLEILKLLREMRDDNNESRKRSKKNSGKENNNDNVNNNKNDNKNNGRNSSRNNNGNNNKHRKNRNSNRNNNSNSNNNNGSSGFVRDVSHYCYAHGACSHDSKDCFKQGNNHNDNATFANKMGGSTSYCNNNSE